MQHASGEESLDLSDELVYEYIAAGCLDEALRVARQIKISSSERRDTSHYIKAGRFVAWIYYAKASLDSAEETALEVLPLAERCDDHHASLLYNQLGLIATHKAHFDQAISYFFKALPIRKRLKREKDVATCLMNIGLLYYKISDYENALTFSMEALAVKQQIGDRRDLALLLGNIALIQNTIDKSKGHECLREARRECDVDCTATTEVALEFAGGVIARSDGDIGRAKRCFRESFEMAKDIRDERFILDNATALSALYVETNQLDSAKYFLSQADAFLSTTIFNQELLEIYGQFIALYQRKGDLKGVAYYQSRYISLNDAVYHRHLTTDMMRAEVDHSQRQHLIQQGFLQQLLHVKEGLIISPPMD